jgi:phosphoglycolate phosphatase
MIAVIFDLDGTLAETAPDLIGALNSVAWNEGWPGLDPVTDRGIAGRGGRALLQAAIQGAGLPPDPARVEDLLPAFLAAYEARIAAESHLYPGAEACLDALEAEGWRVGVCTNKPERLARLLLEALGVGHRFGALLGADTLPVRKPDPRHFTETIVRLGGAPGGALLVGDTVTDRDTARAAGVPCVLTRFGYAVEAPEVLAPEAWIDRLDEVPALVPRLLSR